MQLHLKCNIHYELTVELSDLKLYQAKMWGFKPFFPPVDSDEDRRLKTDITTKVLDPIIL